MFSAFANEIPQWPWMIRMNVDNCGNSAFVCHVEVNLDFDPHAKSHWRRTERPMESDYNCVGSRARGSVTPCASMTLRGTRVLLLDSQIGGVEDMSSMALRAVLCQLSCVQF